MLIDSRVWMDDESNEKTRPMFDQFVPCQTPCVFIVYRNLARARARRLRTRQRRTNEGILHYSTKSPTSPSLSEELHVWSRMCMRALTRSQEG